MGDHVGTMGNNVGTMGGLVGSWGDHGRQCGLMVQYDPPIFPMVSDGPPLSHVVLRSLTCLTCIMARVLSYSLKHRNVVNLVHFSIAVPVVKDCPNLEDTISYALPYRQIISDRDAGLSHH